MDPIHVPGTRHTSPPGSSDVAHVVADNNHYPLHIKLVYSNLMTK